MEFNKNYNKNIFFLLFIGLTNLCAAQHTFSIVAVDADTGEIGSAGATCLDIDDLNGEEGALVISDIILGIGAINTQALWNPINQVAARERMVAGDSPEEIINWLIANDPAPGSSTQRQYGIVDLVGGITGTPRAAGFTGSNNISVANHIAGANYAIQGNILISQDVLDDMETEFLSASGTLADKLMAAMQGAKRIGSQSNCASNQTSSKSAFLRVAKVEDLYSNYGHLSVDLNVSKTDFAEDPIDVLQTTYEFYLNNPGTDCVNTVTTFPYEESFESGLGLWEQNDLDLSHIGNTDFDWIRNSGNTPTTNTGPDSANNGDFYLYTESTGANVGFPTKRAVLNSPCLDLSSISGLPTLSFDYHMSGTSLGNLAVRVNDGSGWTTIWLNSEDQGNIWKQEIITLEDYEDETIQIRMDATTGLGQFSDIAIDNISIFNETLSVDNQTLERIKIYPNPFQDVVNIKLPGNKTSKTLIYNLNGKIISESQHNSENYKLDVSSFSSGIYLLKISTENWTSIKRIIKD